MSDINLDFTVSNNSIDFTVQPNDITITPTDVQLSIFAGGVGVPGGANQQVQYNKDGILAGDSGLIYDDITNQLSATKILTTDFNATGNVVMGGTVLSNVNIQANILLADTANILNGTVNANSITSVYSNLGNVGNVTITGGVNGYVLQTDGTGNLDWTAMTGNGGGNGTPGGSNTQVQYNDAGTFGGNAGFTFNEVSGVFTAPYLAGNGNGLSNIQGANISGTVANANYSTYSGIAGSANSVAVANVTGIGNIAVINLTGSTSNVLYGNGTFAPITNIASANFANFAGNVTVAAQPNITSLGNLTILRLTSANIQLGNGSVALGTEDIAIGNTANASANHLGFSSGAVAIGESTYAVRGGVAIGQYAGKLGSSVAANAIFGVAIGQAAGYGSNRGANTVAIGVSSGIDGKLNSVAIGLSSGYALGNNSIAIGAYAAQNSPVVTPNNTITLNATGANLIAVQANSTFIKPIRYISTGNYMYYNPTSGELSYFAPIAAGSNTQIQFNNANALAGNSGFTFNNVTGTIQMPGDLTVAGNLQVGNLIANNSNYANFAGTVLTNAQPNITSVGTLTNLSVSGNITGANIIGTVKTAAQPNITSLGNLTGLQMGQIGFPAAITSVGQIYTSIDGYIQVGASGLWYANTNQLQAGNVIASNFSAGGNANVGNLIFTNATGLQGTNPANVAVSTTISHKVPIVLNGVTYFICLTSTV